MSDARNQAQRLVARGDIRSAAQILKQAEQGGDTRAARELAIWCLEGRLVHRDLVAARALFERAARLGDQPSARVVRAFIAAGIGGPADWPRSLELLRMAAAVEEESARELELIEAMQLTEGGEPVGVYPSELVSESPNVRLLPGFFTPDECAFLVRAAVPLMQPSMVVDPKTGLLVSNPVRTSDAAAFPFVSESPAIHALNKRIAKASGTAVQHGEPLQVLRYRPGQQYRPHFDALGPGENQRMLTFLIWLNDDYEGGETRFEKSGVAIRGSAGDGLLFRNADTSGRADPASQHAGLPVARGEKLIASRWIRQRPLVAR